MADGIFDHIHNDKNGEIYEVADAFARAAIENLNALKISFVEELPTEDIDTRTIYFVPSQTATQENTYDEYINTDGTTSGWELIGSTAVDLTNYYTKTETDDLLADKVDTEAGKGLSSEDYTTAEKTKLATIQAGAEENIQSDWQQANTTADDYIKNKPSLAAVATSGDYSDLSGTPTLATVATSGSYNDLSDKPTIVGQVNSDWNATSGVEEILNKPILAQIATSGQADDVDYDNTSSGLTASNTQDAIDELSQEKADTISLAAVATSGNYNDLTNRPTIPDISTKMDKNDPTGTGSFSMNRAAGSAVGGYSHAEGSDCTASGSFAHAEGAETTSSGRASHSEGYRTTASDGSAHAEGQDTTASGVSSHAEGFDTEASGDSSHAEGSGTRAASDNQHVSGKYNIVDSNDTFAEIIGNGSGDSSRSNARTLDWQGNETITGDLFFGGGSSGLTAQLGAKQATLVSGSNIKTVNGSSILGSGNLTTPRPDNYTVIKDSGSAATQAVSGSWHEDASWTFPATGIWLVQASLTWDSNATGYRMSGINTSVAQPAAINIMRTSAVSGNQTTHNITAFLRVTSTTQRYYLTSLHNAGAALTTYPRVNAIRLTP